MDEHLGMWANCPKLAGKTQIVRQVMQFNERKMQALEIFTQHDGLRPPDWAVIAGFYPTRASFSYLLRLHRMGLLRRRRDYHKRIVYPLSPHGARQLLKRRRWRPASEVSRSLTYSA